MKNKFNIGRFLLLINNDLAAHKTLLLISFASILIISTIVSIFIPSQIYSYEFYGRVYMPHISVIIVILIALVSFSFYELDYSDKSINFINTPATILEKYLGRLVLTIFGYLLAGFAIYIIHALFVFVLNLPVSHYMLRRNRYNILNPVNTDFIKAIGYFLLSHSIFFFGSIYFKKNEFLKTVLFLSLVIFFAFGLLFVLHKIFLPDLSISFFTKVDFNGVSNWTRIMEFNAYKDKLWELIRDILFYVVPPFLWILGYFRLKEEEVINGVQ